MRLSGYRILGISITITGAVLGILYGVFPNETASYVEGTLRLTGNTIVASTIYALSIFWLAVLGFIVLNAVTRQRIWITHFDAEILGSSHRYLGETIQFKASFKGELKHGLFTCRVERPDKREEWWPAYRTFEHKDKRDVGILSGRKLHECSWEFTIPAKHPEGTYTVRVGVHEKPETCTKWFREKTFSLLVTSRSYTMSGGTSSVLTG
jgi:hypothetical protein